jgi:hypothetical protein
LALGIADSGQRAGAGSNHLAVLSAPVLLESLVVLVAFVVGRMYGFVRQLIWWGLIYGPIEEILEAFAVCFL